MATINPRVDFAFKLIFGNEQNKDILLSLLNSILEDYQESPIEWIEILNPFMDREYEKGKTAILDIKARDQNGEYYNIEMQITDQYFYEKRALYYWARLYSSQLGKGSDYDNLKRTVSINILNFETTGKNIKYHTAYRLKEINDNFELTNQEEIHFLEMEKFSKELPDLQKTLDRWIYFIKYAERFSEHNLPEPLKEVESIKKASSVLERISLSDEQREIYEDRLNMYLDERGAIRTAELRGRDREKIEIAKKFLEMGLSVEQVKKGTGLALDEIKKLTDEK